MTEDELFNNAGDATRRSLENILDWEYHRQYRIIDLNRDRKRKTPSPKAESIEKCLNFIAKAH